jgi:hypothetical protein
MSECCHRCNWPITAEQVIVTDERGVIEWSYFKFVCKPCNVRWTRLK